MIQVKAFKEKGKRQKREIEKDIEEFRNTTYNHLLTVASWLFLILLLSSLIVRNKTEIVGRFVISLLGLIFIWMYILEPILALRRRVVRVFFPLAGTKLSLHSFFRRTWTEYIHKEEEILFGHRGYKFLIYVGIAFGVVIIGIVVLTLVWIQIQR
ncbi:MAG: hypothetical protein WC595_00755 [Candidatus Nanoarchaeia archaeon]